MVVNTVEAPILQRIEDASVSSNRNRSVGICSVSLKVKTLSSVTPRSRTLEEKGKFGDNEAINLWSSFIRCCLEPKQISLVFEVFK